MALLRYIIYSLLILISTFSLSFAQDDDFYAEEKEKEPIKLMGLKIGANVGRFTDFQFKPERFSYEGSFDFNLNHKYFGVFEAGYSEIDVIEDNYHYLSDGYFVKVGLEYNLLKKQPTDFLGVGIKLGKANFSQQATDIRIETNQWGTFQTNIDPKNYNAYWLEASVGLKGEIFKNVYMGWAALFKIKVSGGKDSNFQPYDVPGFGDPLKSIKLGVNYYIYYQIPFNRNK